MFAKCGRYFILSGFVRTVVPHSPYRRKQNEQQTILKAINKNYNSQPNGGGIFFRFSRAYSINISRHQEFITISYYIKINYLILNPVYFLLGAARLPYFIDFYVLP